MKIYHTKVSLHENFQIYGNLTSTCIMFPLYTDLLPGRMYTVFVSTATSFTNQLPADVFSAFSASDQVTTTGSSGGGSSVVAIAVAVVLVVLFVIVASVCVIIFLIW